MLPALKPAGLSLADVLESCLAAVSGRASRLDLPPVNRAAVVLVDGLGVDALKARIGHARTLASTLSASSVIESGFPTTTAAALASLTTGLPPGEHGLVGYTVLDPAHDRIVNQLTGWDEGLVPEEWQPFATVFERAVERGVEAIVIGPERYRHTGFTRAVLRGAHYRSAVSIQDRVGLAIEALREPGPGIVYVYIPELDQTAHAHGWESRQWTELLESVDAALRPLITSMDARSGALLTADHGLLDIPTHNHVFVDSNPRLWDGVRYVAGEPRCLQIYLEPDASPEVRSQLIERWREAESGRAWIATRDEAIDAGWFGSVRADVSPRIGDLLVAARKSIAYYDSRVPGNNGRSMVGQHGSWSPAEVRVPLLRFGAFAR